MTLGQKSIARSQMLWDRAKGSLAGGVGSAARLSLMPFFASHGRGSRLFDLDGNEYIDYVLAYGPLILGHAPEPVVNSICRQLEKGTMFGTCFEEEFLLAEEVVKAVPCCDLVRFTNSGTEALHFLLRLARAFTGREKIVKFEGHYHGWTDDIFISVKPIYDLGSKKDPGPLRESPGQPSDSAKNLIILPWNDLNIVEEQLSKHKDEIAAVILEPAMFYHGAIPPEEGYLHSLRSLTERYDILLIFDEIVTGFRLALGGGQEHFGVVPDLCALAKGFAAGLPLAGFGGRQDIMKLVASNRVPHMGTYNTNPIAVVGALAAIRELKRNDCAAMKAMFLRGKELRDGFCSLLEKTKAPFSINGFDSIFSIISPKLKPTNYRDTLSYDLDLMGKLHNALLKRGVMIMGRGTIMMSAAHTKEDVRLTLIAAQKALQELGYM
jgi:glutamate-1-semialdehyde 2,1-aminomutase